MGYTVCVNGFKEIELSKIPELQECDISLTNWKDYIKTNLATDKSESIIACDSNVSVPFCKFVYCWIANNIPIVQDAIMLVNEFD